MSRIEAYGLRYGGAPLGGKRPTSVPQYFRNLDVLVFGHLPGRRAPFQGRRAEVGHFGA